MRSRTWSRAGGPRHASVAVPRHPRPSQSTSPSSAPSSARPQVLLRNRVYRSERIAATSRPEAWYLGAPDSTPTLSPNSGIAQNAGGVGVEPLDDDAARPD